MATQCPGSTQCDNCYFDGDDCSAWDEDTGREHRVTGLWPVPFPRQRRKGASLSPDRPLQLIWIPSFPLSSLLAAFCFNDHVLSRQVF